MTGAALIAIVAIASTLVISGPAAAHKSGNGMPSSRYSIKPYSYNSTWQTPMNAAVSYWNATSGKVSISKSSSAKNWIEAGSYADSYYGLYTRYHPPFVSNWFRIRLNSRTISRDATNFGNFVRSVLSHELGHSFNLDHNGVTSIMNQNRNRNTLYVPQQHDINDVNAYY